MAARRTRLLWLAAISLQVHSTFSLQTPYCCHPRLLLSRYNKLLLHSFLHSGQTSSTLTSRFLPPLSPPIASLHVLRQRLLSTGSNENENDKKSIETSIIQNKTLHWLKQVVIGLNLCPFADHPYRQQQIRIQVVPGNDTTVVLEHVLEELFYRRDHAPGTTLVICPDLFPNQFVEFWNVANFIDTTLIPENDGLTGQIQVAPFHPLFVFEGSNETSSDNYTNRAPYPIFHILREDEVSRAVDQLNGNAATVWRRNVDLLETLHRELTSDEFETVMTGNYYAFNNDNNNNNNKKKHLLELRVKQILRQFRVQLATSQPTAKTTPNTNESRK